MADIIVTMQDVRSAGLCARGAKGWFVSHGLDFRAFLKDGMTLSDVERMGDALADRVATHVRARQEGGTQ